MFTGIVQDLVPVVSIVRDGNLIRLALDLGDRVQGLQTGASVAVNGTCLTVTRIEQATAWFDVIAETQRMTNLGDLAQGDLVNVERSFHVGDEVGGHIVSGHVTATATLEERRVVEHDHSVRFVIDAQWMKYIFHKGFIALDGASVTVSSVDRDAGAFEISLIPETLERTTLGIMQPGDRINVEVDAQTLTTVDTVERVLAERYAD